MYTEAYHGPGASQEEMGAVGTVIMNRWEVVNGYFSFSPNGVLTNPNWGTPDLSIFSIVNAKGQFAVWSNGSLTATAQATLTGAENSDFYSSTCTDLFEAITAAFGYWNDRGSHPLYTTGDESLVYTDF